MVDLRSPRFLFLCAFQFLVLVQIQVSCYQYKVGDLDAWGIPTSANPQVYTYWSKYHTLKIWDSLCKFLLSILFLRSSCKHFLAIAHCLDSCFSVLVSTKSRFCDSSHTRKLQLLQPDRSHLVHEQWQLFI